MLASSPDRTHRSLDQAGAGENSARSCHDPVTPEFFGFLARRAPANLAGPPTACNHPRVRILLVEDTHDVGEAICRRFQQIGHTVDWETDGTAASDILAHTAYDLLILDVMLPGMDGFSILKTLRRARIGVPVLVLTARSEIDDRVGALDLGADDYLVKPFDFRELEARARVLLRRSSGGDATNVIVCGDIRLDRTNRNVTVGRREVQLKRREIALLEILASRPGRVFRKDELLDQLFGFDEAAGVNAIELYVGRLRKKLEGASARIVTLRGSGYQLVSDDAH
jgi:two-component system response regulator TctD